MIGRTQVPHLWKRREFCTRGINRSSLIASVYGAVCESEGEVADCFLRSRIDKNGLSIA
jgi:hypothetical protein